VEHAARHAHTNKETTTMFPHRLQRLSTLLLAGIIATAAIFAPASAETAEATAQPDFKLEYKMSPSVQGGQPFTFKVGVTNTGTAPSTVEGFIVGGALYYGHTITSVETNSPELKCVFSNDYYQGQKRYSYLYCVMERAVEPGEHIVAVVEAVASSRPGSARLHSVVVAVVDWEPKNNEFDTTFQIN